jgi:hypothetical protein
MLQRVSAAMSTIRALRVWVVEWAAVACVVATVLFFIGKVGWSIHSDPVAAARWFEHGWVWFLVQCGGLFLLLWVIWGFVYGAMLPCVGYSTEGESGALLMIASSAVMLFVVGLAPKAIDGTVLLLYLLLLNIVTHGIAAVMEAVGLGIRARENAGGWLRDGWMGVKRLAYFAVTGYALMILVWWWSQDSTSKVPDGELLAAAKRGDASAQNSWAVRLDRRGQRVESLVWLEKAVAQGQKGAMCNLAIATKESDPARAFALLSKAAESGMPRALYLLGRCHRDGVGTKVDKYRAAELFRNAAFSTGGYPPAMNDLMVLIHTELPDSFRSELFQKLRDGEIKSLEDALETFTPKVETVSDAYELIDDLVAEDDASGGKSSK